MDTDTLLKLILALLASNLLAPFLKSYAEQKGKSLATHEDIERVVEEVRAVTRETERIKATISSDLWNRQAAWTMKRDGYVELLAAASGLELAFGHDQMVSDLLEKGALQLGDARVAASEKGLADSWARVHQAVAIGRLIFDAQAVTVLDLHTPTGLGVEGANTVHKLRKAIVQEAHRELGLNASPADPNTN